MPEAVAAFRDAAELTRLDVDAVMGIDVEPELLRQLQIVQWHVPVDVCSAHLLSLLGCTVWISENAWAPVLSLKELELPPIHRQSSSRYEDICYSQTRSRRQIDDPGHTIAVLNRELLKLAADVIVN